MKKYFTLVILVAILLYSQSMLSQCPIWNWALQSQAYNAQSAYIAPDNNGNVYVSGVYLNGPLTIGTSTFTNYGAFDFFLAKYTAAGNFVWAQAAGGLGYDGLNRIATDAAGNIYATGSFQSASITIGGHTFTNASSAYSDIAIIKFDPNGNVIWTKTAGGTGNDLVKDIAVDQFANIYITGQYESTPAVIGGFALPSASSFTAKLDSSGNFLWAHGVNVNGGTPWTVCVDNAGNVYSAGSFYYQPYVFGQDTLHTNGVNDFYLVKYDPNGNVLFAKNAGGTGTEEPYDLCSDSFGHIYMTGTFESNSFNFGSGTVVNSGTSGSEDIALLAFDTLGNELWGRSMGGIGNFETGQGVTADANGNVYVTGSFYSTTADFGGFTLTNSSNNNSDVFVASYDSSGTVLWAVNLGGALNDRGCAVQADANSDIYISGDFGYTMTIGSANLNTMSTQPDIYFAKMSCITTGLGQYENITEKKIFPNPASNSFTLENISSNATIKMYDFSGRLVLTQKTYSAKTIVNTNNLQNGIFLVEVMDENGQRNFQRVVINK